jgi:hypothetical protein
MSALRSLSARFDLGALRRPLLLGGAAVALLLALLLAWLGWQGGRGAEVNEQTTAVRDRLHGELGRRLVDVKARFGSLMEDRFLRADLSAGAHDEAAERLRAAWPALTAAAAHAASLDEVYSQPPASFGYARLALITRAAEPWPTTPSTGSSASAARVIRASRA